jgi:hypothetical protein
VHRIVERNGGIGVRTTAWGSRMPGADNDERRALLEEEGARFDKNGRFWAVGWRCMESTRL